MIRGAHGTYDYLDVLSGEGTTAQRAGVCVLETICQVASTVVSIAFYVLYEWSCNFNVLNRYRKKLIIAGRKFAGCRSATYTINVKSRRFLHVNAECYASLRLRCRASLPDRRRRSTRTQAAHRCRISDIPLGLLTQCVYDRSLPERA
ncbi:hypothetical protein ARMSODRAFT_41317 [Armillaria solidipes]|uniref:Uncharacterized protein n=1 Tax=Armillaria solidipes TaxID=1076256 RepID=A0A2H3C5T2_9AGAR|nr:hypothetical protein ARMSODRAFT_41317 [Armillaria solidipes]